MATTLPLKTPATDVLLRVRGTVQGVGYRPFVHRKAAALGLSGWVLNDAEGVLIRVAGQPANVEALTEALVHEAPRSATVRVVEPAELFLLYKSDLDGLMERHPRIANRIIMNLVRMLIERLRETSEHFVVETLTKPSQTK